ncbi:hypothetical protein NOCA1240329 [metagenome]|uniref:Uncharacterized protein n=1 Tax=metagenome TaxID=256318 RepID=A0A2P2CGW9_9ZZZZ
MAAATWAAWAAWTSDRPSSTQLHTARPPLQRGPCWAFRRPPAQACRLPLWICQNLFRPDQAPVVNVGAAALIVLSVIPIWLPQELAGADESVAAAR